MSSQKASALQSKFLASLSGEERTHIFTLSKKLEERVRGWVEGYPQLMRAVRVPQGCLTLAAAAPFLDETALLPAARMIFWIFAADDLADSHSVPAAELWSRLERGVALLDNPRQAAPEGDALLRALGEIRDELAGSPRFSSVRPHLAEGLRRFVKYMRRESEWSAAYHDASRRQMPSFNRYLKNERQTTGSRIIYMCLLTRMSETPVSPEQQRLFLELEYHAALSIRLANDLRGYERELAEGKLNALTILQHELMRQHELEGKGKLEEGEALNRARAVVNEKISAGLKRCQELNEERKLVGTSAERGLIMNIAAFACDFYAHHDYHHNLVRPNA